MSRVLALLALLASPAFAEDCGKFADPLAYNACLARQGPAARATHVGRAPAVAPAYRPPRVHSAIVTRRGRSELVFTPRR
jgi:hypothetical protein